MGSTAACKKKMSDTLEVELKWCSNSLITLIPKIPLKSTEERGQEAITLYQSFAMLKEGSVGVFNFPIFSNIPLEIH